MPTYSVRVKRDRQDNLQAANRTYRDGTLVVERGTDGYSRLKAADGILAYNSLPYIADPSSIGGISVKQFGAVGNDIANDGPAFQRAIDAALPGQTIYVWPGTYRFTTGVTINKTVSIVGASQMGPVIRCVGGITAFNFQPGGWGSHASGLHITGDRTPGQKGMFFGACGETVVSNCRLTMLDIGIHVTGGNHHRFQFLFARNIRDTVFWFEDGVGPTLTHCFYDTDGSWYQGGTLPQPNYGIRINTEGVIINNCDMIHAGIGLMFECTNARSIDWALLNNFYIDSCLGRNAITIRNSSTNGRYIRGLLFEHVWSATGDRGITIDGVSNDINGILFSDCRFHNNHHEGANIQRGTNIVFDGCLFAGNSIGGTANDMLLNTNGFVQVKNSNFGRFMRWSTFPPSAIFLGTTQGDTTIENNFFDSLSYPSGVLVDNSAGLLEIRNNRNLVSENQGTALIGAGSNTVTVAHGLYTTPQSHEVQVTPVGGWGNASEFWADSFGPTTFRIATDVAPGFSGLTLAWKAEIRRR